LLTVERERDRERDRKRDRTDFAPTEGPSPPTSEIALMPSFEELR